MSKFKVDDYLLVVECPEHWEGEPDRPQFGEIFRSKAVDSTGVFAYPMGYAEDRYFKLVVNRTNWHPHHDEIVAWAKGAKIRGRANNRGSAWRVFTLKDVPLWDHDWEYEVIPGPDHTAEIAEIERKMRELSEDGKRLADRLEKLK